MPSIFIILIIVVLIMLGAFFAVMVRIGAAGVNPSKLMSDIFEKKTDDNDTELKNKLRANVTIQRCRVTAGILFGLDILFLGFFGPALLSSIYPWAHYIFWPLLITTVIVFIILRKKEQKVKNNL